MSANIWLPVACITLIFGVLVIYVSDLKIMLPVFNFFKKQICIVSNRVICKCLRVRSWSQPQCQNSGLGLSHTALFHLATCCIAIVKCTVLKCYCLLRREIYSIKVLTLLDVQVELSKFVADHDFCLEIKYEEQHQPHVIIEKGDTDKGVHTHARTHARARTHTHTHTHTI